MGKQLGLPPRNALEPVPSPSVVSSQSFVFLLRPSSQAVVEVAEDRMERGSIGAARVVEPAPHHGIKHPRQVVKCFVRTPMQGLAPHRVPHGCCSPLADCRCEVGEVPSEAIL
ncbi:MAG TPA: hypothetical protein VKK81_13810 [Candidatus Binatia bacterium]|nr:hypothetical protein [Candidatus Binatia bacterium]